MSNGVKFCRGTLDSFQTLKQKDPNTLYFITDNRKKTSYLYLGEQLIVGGNDVGVLSISDLSNTKINKVADGDVLTYNAETKQWINKTPKQYITESDLNLLLEDYVLSWGEIKEKGD